MINYVLFEWRDIKVSVNILDKQCQVILINVLILLITHRHNRCGCVPGLLHLHLCIHFTEFRTSLNICINCSSLSYFLGESVE